MSDKKNKNFISYMLMGIKKNDASSMEQRKAEELKELERKKFNKAFSDKTYTVAKKVIGNVEKIADYDYETFFSNIGKVFDDKFSEHKEDTRNQKNDREERSKEFEKKVEEHKKKFNIDEYSIKSKNYKDGLLARTKENIKKKEKESKEIALENEKSKIIKNSNKKISLDKKNKVILTKKITKDINSDIVSTTDKKNILLVDISEKKINKENITIKNKHNEKLKDRNKKAEEVLKNYTEAKYSKKNLETNSNYYKKQKKTKFAKRISVELEDSIIVKKRKSISRLFKFSIAFKLSFVFILLIICTVATLSVAFYFGIDFVIDLNNAGRIEDIDFFKDILLILLIIFNFITALVCISVATRSSKGIVEPIDEITKMVRQINANDMDRRLDVKGIHDELRELAVTFNEMLDRIEKSYETQNRFTSDASHELRTPIAVIQGYINMLDRWGKGDEDVLNESIEAIKSESKNMKKLTEKLLLLAKADKGVLELDFSQFELCDLINEITKETQMIDSNHTVTNKINDVKTIYADKESLKQAIRIFVDNSVKYTPEGGIIQLNSYINKKKIYIEISDNGIGISKEDMENIFNRFYRVDSSRNKETGGHGLGLSISKWIINQHNGQIEVKSEIGKGTVVTIILSPLTIS